MMALTITREDKSAEMSALVYAIREATVAPARDGNLNLAEVINAFGQAFASILVGAYDAKNREVCSFYIPGFGASLLSSMGSDLCEAPSRKQGGGMSNDLPNHAADKVKRALDDVHQIASDPGEMLRIALMGAGICIGQACGILHGMMKNQGANITEREVKEQIFDILRTTTIDGAEATIRKLRSTDEPSQQE